MPTVFKYTRSIMLKLRFLFIALFFLKTSSIHARNPDLALIENKELYRKPWVLGLSGGFGDTTWQGLVPKLHNQNSAITLSTPIQVNEGGKIWGLNLAYELNPSFAIETNYLNYPPVKIKFDDCSLFAFYQNGSTELITQTSNFSVSFKIMGFIPRSNIRIFSSAGLAKIIRKDLINQNNIISPQFGLGANMNILPHLMIEIGLGYTSGYGESEINPVDDFFPFFLSAVGKLAYRF